MNVYESALTHVRNSVATAEVLGLKSCAILVSDLKLLLEMVEDALQDEKSNSQPKAP